ncbi:hypothetical protein V8G54_001538, partial [Vigna mungo]
PCTLLSLPFSPLLFGEFLQLYFASSPHTSPCFCPIFPVQCKSFQYNINLIHRITQNISTSILFRCASADAFLLFSHNTTALCLLYALFHIFHISQPLLSGIHSLQHII